MNGVSADASRGVRDYIEIINEWENIEQIITPPKYRRYCYDVLEVLKASVKHFKIKSK